MENTCSVIPIKKLHACFYSLCDYRLIYRFLSSLHLNEVNTPRKMENRWQEPLLRNKTKPEPFTRRSAFSRAQEPKVSSRRSGSVLTNPKRNKRRAEGGERRVGARVTWLLHRPAVCCRRTERRKEHGGCERARAERRPFVLSFLALTETGAPRD